MTQYKETLLRIKDLRYEVKGKVILNNLSVDLNDIVGTGQVATIVGPSGSGKTTLFKLLSGIIKPTSGTIEFLTRTSGGKYIKPHPGIMGVVAQKYPLFDHLTVLGNLRVTTKPKDECVELLKEFHMEDCTSKKPDQLSGGQCQRVATMQQLLCSNQYLLMDEPFSGLDLIAKCESCRWIKHTADLDESNVVICITHGIDEAIRVADYIWLLGRDKDEQGNYCGANIKEVINLNELGMTRQCCSTPKFNDMKKYIEEKFKQL